MIIDAHYHLEEQLESIDTLLEQMQRNNVDRVALIPRINEPFHRNCIGRNRKEEKDNRINSRTDFCLTQVAPCPATPDVKRRDFKYYAFSRARFGQKTPGW